MSWDTSDYINFTGDLITTSYKYWHYRIYIDDSNPNYTWSKWESENDWCTGSGTYSDPYIIENLYINGQGSGGMIFIEKSNKHFIIRNCWFNFSGPNEFDDGVCLYRGTCNGTVENNIITYTHIGVNVLESQDIKIANNIMISDHTTAEGGRAIDIESESQNIIVLNNRIRNFRHGIYLYESTNCSLDGNYAENTIWGEDFEGSPIYANLINYSQIVRNTLAGSFAYGTFEVNEIECTGNVIVNNTVVYNETLEFGPETAGTLNVNTPKIQADVKPGMTLENSHHNLIAYNRMILPKKEGVIYGYDFILVIGLLSVISVILIRKVIKK